jgi:TRAP-type C4-dicarboxylate transport system permease large subunit
LGGIVPGVLIALLQMGVNRFMYSKRKYQIPTHAFSLKKLFVSFTRSLGALMMPIIIIVGIVTGIVTATEAGVIAIGYGLIYGFWISKKLKIKDMPRFSFPAATPPQLS